MFNKKFNLAAILLVLCAQITLAQEIVPLETFVASVILKSFPDAPMLVDSNSCEPWIKGTQIPVTAYNPEILPHFHTIIAKLDKIPFVKIANYKPKQHLGMGIFWYLGFIGMEAEVKLIDHYLTNLVQAVIEKRYYPEILSSVGECLGMMIARKVPGAEDLYVKKWGEMDYLTNTCKLRPKQALVFLKLLTSRVYSMSHLPLAKTRGTVEYTIDGKTASFIDELVLRQAKENNVTGYKFYSEIFTNTPSAEEQMLFVNEMKKKHPTAFKYFGITVTDNFDVANKKDKTFEKKTINNEVTKCPIDYIETKFLSVDQNASALLAEAQNEFNNFYEKDFDAVAERLLDDEIPLRIRYDKQWNNIRENLKNDYIIEQKILGEIKTLKIKKYLNPTVDITLEMSAEQMRPVFAKQETSLAIAATAKIKSRHIVTVKFELPDTNEMAKKYIPNHLPKDLTFTKSGNLVVYMKKINDQWYWNPFGW